MSMFLYKGMKMAETVSTPVQSILTQAEFDALPVEQQSNGFYIIDDGGEKGNTGDIYSTKETRIGTWIDGKPLYRKVIIAGPYSKEARPALMNTTGIDFSAVQLQTYLRDDNIQIYSSGLDFYSNSTDYGGVTLYKINNKLYAYFNNIGVKSFLFAFIYTKTTDTATKAVGEPLVAMTYDTPNDGIIEASASSAIFEINASRNGEGKVI